MNKVLILSMMVLGLSCKKVEPERTAISKNDESTLVGHWDNFQQYWLENTETDMHRTETDDKHRHLSLQIEESPEGTLKMEVREGRNGKTLVDTMALSKDAINETPLRQDGDTLFLSGLEHFDNSQPYKFIRTRKFAGWIEMPLRQYPDSIHRKKNLEIHDQGGMADIYFEGKHYTAELTQLLFGKKLAIMKLAVYDMPLDCVQINSRSISYTWLNPDSKRTGINLRKVATGWTFIEPGFVNSDNTDFKKK